MHGGGVLLLFAMISSQLKKSASIYAIARSSLSIKFAKTKTLLFSSYYRPPSPDTNALDLLDDVLSGIYSSNPLVVLAGDFNCGGIDWSTRNLTPRIAQACDQALLDFSDKYGLIQHVSVPTRPASGRTLDLVFSSNPGIIKACHVTCGISDHDAILFEVDISPKFTPKPPRKMYQFHKGDFVGLKSSLSTLAPDYLSTQPESKTVDENWSYISQKILEATDNFIPHKMSKGKRHLPWVSTSVKRLMNKRDRAYKKAQHSGKAVHFTKYKQLRNITTKHLRVAHDKYVSEVMGGLTPESLETGPKNIGSSGIKRAWSYLKLLRTESQGIPALVSNNRVCSSDSAKAEALREQYNSAFVEEDLRNLPQMPPSPYECMPDIIFSAEGVKNQLLKSKIDKASGPDLIPARILRDAASELAVVFSSLFQQSYDAGTLPHAWKLANICAIFKKGSKADPKNYRPVSLTSLTSKVMEHIVSCQISRHLNANHIISPHQHGFQRGLSCETQLITVIHEWASVLNVHGQVNVVFLDFAKAFDSVPHEWLLLKAAFYGIRNKANHDLASKLFNWA